MATDREITRPRAPSPSSESSRWLSATCSPWVISRSVTTASASLPQTILVSRLVESMPRILTDTLGGCPVLNKEVHAL